METTNTIITDFFLITSSQFDKLFLILINLPGLKISQE